MTLRRTLRALLAAYGLACAAALAFAAIGVFGLFGGEPDALAAVYALILAAPWSLLAPTLLSESGALANLAFLAGGMLLNAAGLFALAKLAPRR